MSKTAKPKAISLLQYAEAEKGRIQGDMLETMFQLKAVNPGDTYYEQYLGMIEKYGADFFDTYHIIRTIGEVIAPVRILEIGVRTGISLCQLLSAHQEIGEVEDIVCVDPFDQWTGPNIVRANLRKLKLPHDPDTVKILAIRSDDYFRQLDSSPKVVVFDYILVDGDHSKPAAYADLQNAHRYISKGGVIVFDDISTNPGECALITEWEKWKAEHKDEYEFCEKLEGKGVAWAIRR